MKVENDEWTVVECGEWFHDKWHALCGILFADLMAMVSDGVFKVGYGY